jgi:hypothetical protein
MVANYKEGRTMVRLLSLSAFALLALTGALSGCAPSAQEQQEDAIEDAAEKAEDAAEAKH